MASKVWYLFKDNHHIGPFSTQEIKEQFDRGEFSSSIPVWREGDAEWVPLANQTELASFVMPTEVVELPPLPPLPSEAYAEELPNSDLKVEDYLAPVADDSEDVDLSKKMESLENSAPNENVNVADFWSVDTSEDLNIPEEVSPQVEETPPTPESAWNEDEKTSLQEKLSIVRSRLGDDVRDNDQGDGSDDPAFIKKVDVVDDHFQSDDPIRSNQSFDGDDDLPDFMSESSVDYLSQGQDVEEAQASPEEMAAMSASTEDTGFLADEQEGFEHLNGGEDKKGEELPDFNPIEDESIDEIQELTEQIQAEAQNIEETPLYDEQDDEYEEDEEYEEFDEFEAPAESASKFWLKIVAVITFVSLLGVTSSQLFFQKKKIPSLDKLSKTDSRAFREIIESDSSRFSYKFAVSDDNSLNIWFGNNQSDPGVLDVRIESKKKRVLSKDKIVAVGKTSVLGYIGRFKEIRVLEGQQLAEGEYRIKGTFKVGGSKAKLIEWLKHKTPLGKLKQFKNKKTTYQIDSSFYYTQKRGEEFREAVAKFWDSIRIEKSKPLLVELQKWRTLKTLSEKMLLIFSDAIGKKKIKIKAASELFQKHYAANVAPVFQTLTLDTQALIQKEGQLLPEQVSRLETLLDFQKGFGSDVAENLEALSKYKKLTKNIIKSLNDDARLRHDKFIVKVDEQVNKIQDQISKATEVD